MTSGAGSVIEEVAFEHPFFKTNADGCFQLAGADRQPAYVMKMGDQMVSIPVSGLKREFAASGWAGDRAMLDAIVESLKYVTALRLGESLPNEAVTGEPSWAPEARHRALAHQRIIAAMVRWYDGDAAPLTGRDDLRRFLSGRVDRAKITEALKHLDTAMGSAGGDAGDGLTRIHPLIKTLAADLSYIEALRENVDNVRRIGDILRYVRHTQKGRPAVALEIAPVLRLHRIAMRTFDDKLAHADRQLADVGAMVSAYDASRRQFRQIRNDLHAELTAWKGTLADWARVTPGNIEVGKVLAQADDLYRFLAPRYMQVKEWTPMADAKPE